MPSLDFRHADCRDFLRTLGDGEVDFVLCDPPYGLTALHWDVGLDWELLWPEIWRVCKPNAAVALFSQQPTATDMIVGQRRHFRYDLIWQKSKPSGYLSANKMPMRCHEHILLFYRKLPTYNPQKTKGAPYKDAARSAVKNHYGQTAKPAQVNSGFRYPLSVQQFGSTPTTGSKHNTQKPVPLLEWLIATYSNPGDLVLDFTAGSGSSLIAARNLGRRWAGCEKDAAIFAAAKKRIAEDARHDKLRLHS